MMLRFVIGCTILCAVVRLTGASSVDESFLEDLPSSIESYQRYAPDRGTVCERNTMRLNAYLQSGKGVSAIVAEEIVESETMYICNAYQYRYTNDGNGRCKLYTCDSYDAVLRQLVFTSEKTTITLFGDRINLMVIRDQLADGFDYIPTVYATTIMPHFANAFAPSDESMEKTSMYDTIASSTVDTSSIVRQEAINHMIDGPESMNLVADTDHYVSSKWSVHAMHRVDPIIVFAVILVLVICCCVLCMFAWTFYDGTPKSVMNKFRSKKNPIPNIDLTC